MRIVEAPVLIVGGGPVGLALSIDLGWRGVGTILIEQEGPDARRLSPRMDNVGIRTMEFCRRWGIVKEIENAGFPRDLPLSIVYATGLLGFELGRDEYPNKADAVPPPFSPQTHELCPQNYFDPVLQKAAARYQTNSLMFRHRLDRIEQGDDGVVAQVLDLDRKEWLTIRAR